MLAADSRNGHLNGSRKLRRRKRCCFSGRGDGVRSRRSPMCAMRSRRSACAREADRRVYEHLASVGLFAWRWGKRPAALLSAGEQAKTLGT